MAPALAAASVANAAKISAKSVASTKASTTKATMAKSPAKGSSSKAVAVRPSGTDVDLVRSYLRDIGRVPLLSHQQEITLGRQVQELMDLEAQEAELSDQRGGEAVPAAELAKAAGLSPVQLKRKLQAGRRAKERMVAANLRLVVSVGGILYRYIRLDQSVVDDEIAHLDSGFSAYRGMMLLDHTLNNPIVLVFAELLIRRIEAREAREALTKALHRTIP